MRDETRRSHSAWALRMFSCTWPIFGAERKSGWPWWLERACTAYVCEKRATRPQGYLWCELDDGDAHGGVPEGCSAVFME